MLQLYYSDLYTGAIANQARFPRQRYRMVMEGLETRSLTDRIVVRPARPAAPGEIRLAHDPAYVEQFLSGSLGPDEQRRIGFRPWTDDFIDRVLLVTGASIQALETALGGAGMAGNLAGGTHHAFRDRGSGYCVFNDLAICARLALRDHGVERVFIADLDVHQGDGTAAMFRDEPPVFTYSLHCQRNFPFRKMQSDCDVGLPEGSGDEEYLAALGETLPRCLYEFRPDLVLFQAGTDPLAEDTLGRLRLTRSGLRRRNELLFDYAADWDCPVVIFMGGGYADPIDRSVEAHLDVFEEAANRLGASGHR